MVSWLLDHRDCNNPCNLKLRRMVARRLFEESLALSHPGLAIVIGAISVKLSRKMAGRGGSDGYRGTLRHQQAHRGLGAGDVLLDNSAWALRRFQVLPVFGGGGYKVQPINAEDLAGQAAAGCSQNQNTAADAAEPETFTFEELVRLLASAVGGPSGCCVRCVPGLSHGLAGRPAAARRGAEPRRG